MSKKYMFISAMSCVRCAYFQTDLKKIGQLFFRWHFFKKNPTFQTNIFFVSQKMLDNLFKSVWKYAKTTPLIPEINIKKQNIEKSQNLPELWKIFRLRRNLKKKVSPPPCSGSYQKITVFWHIFGHNSWKFAIFSIKFGLKWRAQWALSRRRVKNMVWKHPQELWLDESRKKCRKNHPFTFFPDSSGHRFCVCFQNTF